MMAEYASRSKQGPGHRLVTLSSLPNDILGKIIGPLSFQEKCCLELVDKGLHAFLSSPVPAEGLWGRCNMLLDLKLDHHLDSSRRRHDTMRWLKRRLPGFTHLICRTGCVHKEFCHRDCQCPIHFATASTENAAWLVGQLPNLSKTGVSGCQWQLYLAMTSDVARGLLTQRTANSMSRIQHGDWAALSERLTELSFVMDTAHGPVRMAALSQLTQLTSLKILQTGPVTPHESEVLSLSGLQSLHMIYCVLEDLKLECPRLRSLTLESCKINGRLLLEAPLEELTSKGDFAASAEGILPSQDLLGASLTRLLFHACSRYGREMLCSALPFMSGLRSLDVVFSINHLPQKLPASLQVIRYVFQASYSWRHRRDDLQRFADIFKLPELQDVSILNCCKWEADVIRLLRTVAAESKANVTLEECFSEQVGPTFI